MKFFILDFSLKAYGTILLEVTCIVFSILFPNCEKTKFLEVMLLQNLSHQQVIWLQIGKPLKDC